MTYIKKIIALFCCLALVFTLAGCGDDVPETRVYFELPDIPSTVDPQTASGASELIIVRNMYEGLLRYDENGELANGVAEKYSVSGLTYTFNLRKDAHWDSGEPLTAHDFVFGLRRAVDPDTKSPFVSRLFCISGAEAIYNGNATTESLGVKATDDHTLTITLAREDADFLHNLTTAPFMPCNEDFFKESVGKYGLTQKNVLANGSYYMGKWNQEDFGIRLYRNAEYCGDFSAKNGAVFLSHNDESTPLDELKEGNVDAAILGAGEIGEAESSGLNTLSTENICWVLTVGDEFSADMRKAFAMLVDSSVYRLDLPDDFRAADSLYPSVLAVDDSVSGVGFTAYDPNSAKALFSSAVRAEQDKKFPSTVLKYYSGAPIKRTVTSIVAHWQQNLSAFINIEGVTSADGMLSQLTDQTMQMAIFPVTADSTSLKEYLTFFGKNSVSGSAADIQKSILSGNSIIPIAFQKTTVAFDETLSGIKIYPGNGYIDFAQVVKKD